MLWTLLAVIIAAAGDTVNDYALSLVIGPDQIITTVLNVIGGSLAIVRLALRGKSINRYDLAMSLPALVTCIN